MKTLLDYIELPKWDIYKKQLTSSQKKKAKLLIKMGKVKSLGCGEWLIEPIEGYNKTPHKVEFSFGRFICDCQYFNTKQAVCSHILAVMFLRGETYGMEM